MTAANSVIVSAYGSGVPLRDWVLGNGLSAVDAALCAIDELYADDELALCIVDALPLEAQTFIGRGADGRARHFLRTALAFAAVHYGRDSSILVPATLTVADVLPDGLVPELFDRELLLDVASARLRSSSNVTCGGYALALLTCACALGFHSGDPVFDWATANLAELWEASSSQAGRCLREAFPATSYPSFDLVRTWTGDDCAVRRIEFDTDSRFCRDLLRDSVSLGPDGPHIQTCNDPFFREFVGSIGFVPNSLEDFTTEVFDRQVSWFHGRLNSWGDPSPVRFLRRFYIHLAKLLPEDQRQFTFETGLVPELFHYHFVIQGWVDGYRAVIHNPLDPPPTFSRWFLFPSADELARTNLKPEAYMVDASFEDPEIERLVIGWLWGVCDNVMAVRRLPGLFRRFFALVAEDGPQTHVAHGTVQRFVEARLREGDAATLRHNKAWLRSLLRYGEQLGVLEVEPSCYMLLSTSEKAVRWHPNESTAVPLDDLSQVLEYLEQSSENDPFDQLVHIALCTQSLTPLRIGDIASLKRQDLVRDEHGRTRAVTVTTKTDGYWRHTVQLPASVADLLDALEAATRPLADVATPRSRDYIFLYRGHERLSAIRLRPQDITMRVKEVCSELDLPPFTPRNVRRRYETEVVLRGIRKNISRLALRPLTGHRNLSTTDRYYVRDDVRDYLEAVHGIEIGVPNVVGEILPTAPDPAPDPGDTVEGGAGFCRNPSCNVAGTLTCLMCSGFLTTPDCIPEMEEALLVVEGQIAKAGANQHERDHLLSVKRLYLGYLAVMRSMAEGSDDAR